jgi:hypothetical protein
MQFRAESVRGGAKYVWDLLITIGNLAVIPALVPTLINRRAYVPRLTSGLSVLGISVVVTGLAGAGLVLSPIVVGVIGLMWALIFVFRGRHVGEL